MSDTEGKAVGGDIPPTLVLTGHFPPEPGGVQTFVWELLQRLPQEHLVVVAPRYRGDEAFDRSLPFPVYRRRGYVLIRHLRRIVRESGATTAWIPAAAPFGLFAPWLRAAGVERIVCSSHGQEMGWLRVGPTREALRRVARQLDVLTYLGAYTRSQLERIVERPELLHRLAGGVDLSTFHPGAASSGTRERLGLCDGPVVVSVSRLVRRKGHDVLMRAWPRIVREIPDAQLLIVGVGPMRRRLLREAAKPQMRGSVHVPGYLPLEEMAAALDASDVFVLPCRDDRAGLQTEGLGLAVLEASAVGLPVVVGRSGGSGDSVLPGRTGLLVDATREGPLADALLALLTDPATAREMGGCGARWVRENWTWDRSARRLAELLRG